MRDVPWKLGPVDDHARDARTENDRSRPEAGFAGREASAGSGRSDGAEGDRGGTRGSARQELPGQLTADELAELFEARTAFIERLAAEPDPLVRARTLVHELTDDEKREVVDAHPAIGQRTGLSKHSAAEQGGDVDPAVIAELMRLNAEYEARHGFRFCVFVNRRPKSEILDVLRTRIDNPTDVELETALDELVAIAEDRWRRG
jgi:2-oxo-4-hydroxy-4-carboxy--5-ureidoimidazoline (OHCU) decarboxylase